MKSKEQKRREATERAKDKYKTAKEFEGRGWNEAFLNQYPSEHEYLLLFNRRYYEA